MKRFEVGQMLTFTKDLEGVCKVTKGDKLIYLGNSQARILTGESTDWLVTLCIDAPVS